MRSHSSLFSVPSSRIVARAFAGFSVFVALTAGVACSSDEVSNGAESAGATGAGAEAGGGAGGTAGGGAAGSAANGGNNGGTGGGAAGSAGVAGNGGGAGTPTTAETFTVRGRHLYDRCGEKVILRGVNEMVVWSPGKDGDPEFAEIAKTGANVVRIVWTNEGNAAELDKAISNAVAAQLIPMVEHHSATGDLSKVPAVVDYWLTADVLAVLKKHSPNLLLNIANEPADKESDDAWEAAFKTAITRIRDAGLTVPLIIDANGYGQNIDALQLKGPALIAHDPLGNVMLSVHMWWADATGDRVKTELDESVKAELPLIVGEFAQHAVWQCSANPFAYKVLMAEAQRLEVGWLAWSWGSVVNNDCKDSDTFDMTNGGVFGSWKEPWGEDVAVKDPNSIKNTSVRPRSMVSGTCQ